MDEFKNDQPHFRQDKEIGKDEESFHWWYNYVSLVNYVCWLFYCSLYRHLYDLIIKDYRMPGAPRYDLVREKNITQKFYTFMIHNNEDYCTYSLEAFNSPYPG